jgi:hypothetical protein
VTVTLERPDHDWTRDGYGRPIILPDPRWRTQYADPATGETEAPSSWYSDDGSRYPDRRYTRVTTYGEALLDGSALGRWKMRRVALGMGRRPDYVTAAAALTAEDRDKAALNDLAEKALEAAGPNAADIGTALHGFTERMDRGEDVGVVPPKYQADLDAYRRVVEPLTFLHRECRMVCDTLETAGTPDGIAACTVPDPDGVADVPRIVDLKTGNIDYTAGKFSTQLAIYAHSALYDPRDGTRTALELSTSWGLVIHMPAGMGSAQLRWLRLDHGWAGALLAGPVREWRKAGARELSRPVFLPAGVTWNGDGKCSGTYADGRPCQFRAQDNGFCGKHQRQASGDAVVTRGTSEAQLQADALEAVTEQPATVPGEAAFGPLDVDAAGLAEQAAWEANQDDPEDPALESEDAADLDGTDDPDRLDLLDPDLQYEGPMLDPPPGVDLSAGFPYTPVEDPPDDPITEDSPLDPAPDPMDPRQLQGNPRPTTTMPTPEHAAIAAEHAERSLLQQVAGCRSRTELRLLWQATGPSWTPAVVTAATDRAEAVDQEPLLARQRAALLAAIGDAWNREGLSMLWEGAQRIPGLWTEEHTQAIRVRASELAGLQ